MQWLLWLVTYDSDSNKYGKLSLKFFWASFANCWLAQDPQNQSQGKILYVKHKTTKWNKRWKGSQINSGSTQVHTHSGIHLFISTVWWRRKGTFPKISTNNMYLFSNIISVLHTRGSGQHKFQVKLGNTFKLHIQGQTSKWTPAITLIQIRGQWTTQV